MVGKHASSYIEVRKYGSSPKSFCDSVLSFYSEKYSCSCPDFIHTHSILGPVSRKGIFFFQYLPSQHGLEPWISCGCRCLGFPISPSTDKKSQLICLFLKRSSTLPLLLERSLGIYSARVILYCHLDRIQKVSDSTAKMPTSISVISQSV